MIPAWRGFEAAKMFLLKTQITCCLNQIKSNRFIKNFVYYKERIEILLQLTWSAQINKLAIIISSWEAAI